MVDIHAHILPNIDDGASSMEVSLRMAEQAVSQGVRHMAASSHGNYYRYSFLEYWDAFDALSLALKEYGIPLKLYPAQEIYMDDFALAGLQRGDLLTLNHSRYVLVEFAFDESIYTMERLLEGLLKRDYVPVLAHPERYDGIQDDLDFVAYLRDRGCAMQCNGGSLVGQLGYREQETARKLLSRRLVDVLGTDAHDSRYRTTETDFFLEWMEKEYKKEEIIRLISENPSRILKNMPILR